MIDLKTLPVIVIGAGPVGLAATAHLLERGLDPLVLEAGSAVGHSIHQWAHVRLFSPWSLNIDRAARDLLNRYGWSAPCGTGYPTGGDLVSKYLEPLAAVPELAARIRLSHRVTAIARSGVGKVKDAGREGLPFEVHVADGQDTIVVLARAVIDASGTWTQPNPSGSSGLPVPGEQAASAHIRTGMPDVLGAERARYAGKRVLVLGSGHSAIGTLLDLVALADDVPGMEIHWALRKRQVDAAYGGGAADQLAARGELGTQLHEKVEGGRIAVHAGFTVDRIDQVADGLSVRSGDAAIAVDELIVATGFRPDLDMLREIRLGLDPALECPIALAPLIDPNIHSCGSVRPHGAAELSHPETGFFIAGMKSYGRAPTFLMATGYEQVRSIAAHLAGDVDAARRVELVLPETGVCSTRPGKVEIPVSAAASACCA